MRLWLGILLSVMLAFSVSACGNKGKLKTPSQIALDEEKKEKKRAKKEEKAQEEKAVKE